MIYDHLYTHALIVSMRWIQLCSLRGTDCVGALDVCASASRP
jgi:hypothetical protein